MEQQFSKRMLRSYIYFILEFYSIHVRIYERAVNLVHVYKGALTLIQ